MKGSRVKDIAPPEGAQGVYVLYLFREVAVAKFAKFLILF